MDSLLAWEVKYLVNWFNHANVQLWRDRDNKKWTVQFTDPKFTQITKLKLEDALQDSFNLWQTSFKTLLNTPKDVKPPNSTTSGQH